MTGTGAWRKTKQGEWVVIAPPAILAEGRMVTVIARDGRAKDVLIGRVGRTFDTPDGSRAYGYISRQSPGSCDGCGCHRGMWDNFDGCDRCGCDGDG